MHNQSEVEFLKDQVNRLNGVLSYYHDKYLEKSEQMGSNNQGLVFNNHTAPLLLEYDRIIDEMTKDMQSFKALFEEEQLKLRDLTAENAKLWDRVKEAPRDGAVRDEADGIRDNLEGQMDYMRQEKRNLEQLLATAERELHRLQAELAETQMKPQAVIFNEQVDAMRQQYARSMGELENEVVALRDIKRDMGAELDRLQRRAIDLEQETAGLTEQLRLERQMAQESGSLLESAMQRIDSLDADRKQLVATVHELQAALGGQDSAKGEWAAALAAVEARYRDAEQRSYEARQSETEAQLRVDTAIADKRSIEIKLAQAAGETERLRGVIGGILDDAGARTREEVDLVRSRCDKELERVIDELGLCEQDRQQLLVQIDQLKRGRAQLEHEIEQLHRTDRERSAIDQSGHTEIHGRALRAERDRDDVALQLQTAENRWNKDRVDWQRHKDAFEAKMGYLEKKIASLQVCCDTAQSNADKFSKLLAVSEEAAAKNRKEFQESLRTSRHEYEILQQASGIKHRELEARLASTEEIQRHTASEMRQFLTKQQQMGTKWREEAHLLAAQYEERLCQVSQALDRQSQKNGELISLLHESKQKLLEGQETIDCQRETIAMLEARLNIAETSLPLRLTTDHGDAAAAMETVGDDEAADATGWQLQQLKKQQQRQIRESVARSKKVIPTE